jgi:hypothetical protein
MARTSALVVTIPIQIDRKMTPNGRAHWAVKRRIAQDMQTATRYAMRVVVDMEDPDACFQTAPWPLTLHYLIAHGKGRKRLDDDNAIAAMKPVRDQIARCLGMDDRDFVTGSMTQDRDPEGRGFVRVAIEPAAKEQAA